MSRHRWIARAQVAGAVLVLLVAALLSGASAAQADRFRHDRPTIADWGQPPVQVAPVDDEAPIPEPDKNSRIYWIGANRAWDCGGVLTVAHSEQNLIGGHLVQRQSDGAVRVEVHDYSGRFGPHGQWLQVPIDRDMGGRLAWSGFRDAQQNGGHMDLVRVVHTKPPRLVSAPAPIDVECPA